jgi:hypothetical protein
MSMEPMGPMQPKPEGASTVFVLGLLGLLLGCFPLGIVAWIYGNSYMNQCRAMGVEPEGLAAAGRIMGIIATVILILSLVMGIAVFVLMGLMAASIR